MGQLALTLLPLFPSVSDLFRGIQPRPNCVYLEKDGPLYDQFESYVIDKYVHFSVSISTVFDR